MLRAIAGLFLFRFMPRRLLPLVTLWQIVQMLRGRRGRTHDEPRRPRSFLGTRRSPSS